MTGTTSSGLSALEGGEALSIQIPHLIPPDLSWSTSIAAIVSILIVSRVFKFIRALKVVDSLPGLRIPFEPFSPLATILPETWWNLSLSFTWTWRKNNNNIYHRLRCDTVSIVPFISGTPKIYTRSMKVVRQVVVAGHSSGVFGKADVFNTFFLFWGSNVIAAEGESWRKHRKIVSPAFNSEMYAFVWDASRNLYAEMVSAEGWAAKDIIEVSNIQTLVSKFTLTIFGSVGFGFPFTWVNPPAHQGEMSIHECLEIITRTYIFATTAPAWAWKLPFDRIRRIRRAYDTMRAFMQSLVKTTRETVQSEGEKDITGRARDLFTLLVRASENEGGKMGLSDQELIGSVFAFLFAGFETTAHTLAATLAFLALDSNLQDELVTQVRAVTQGRNDDTLLAEDYGRLDKVLATMYEGIRVLPSAPFLIREAKEDTVLDISGSDGPKMLPVKKGTPIVIDMVGVQYNPRYFSEPDEFQPSRWYRKQDDSDENDEPGEFTAFSVGPRACLGRKFATMEGVCFLASLLRDWRVEPLLTTHSDGRVESVDEWRERVLQAKMQVTLGLKDVPLKLVRRRA